MHKKTGSYEIPLNSPLSSFLLSMKASCGRPPDQRDGDFIPAPNWDSAYLTDIINTWNEPVVLEPDYYLLKSMSVFELGTSIQVSILGHEKVQKYMNMALTVAQRGERILKTKLGPGEGADRFWRYQTMLSYIYQYQVFFISSEVYMYACTKRTSH
jgi:hypothetical protein